MDGNRLLGNLINGGVATDFIGHSQQRNTSGTLCSRDEHQTFRRQVLCPTSTAHINGSE